MRKRSVLALMIFIFVLGLIAPMLARAAEPDPSGTNTGVAADVIGATTSAPTKEDMEKLAVNEPLAAKLADVVGHNRIAINFAWTLVCGFLVMFMQAGFAMAETGFTRAKNAGHTMAMNFMVYGIGMLGYWICGFALQMGGVGGVATLGGATTLDSELTLSLFGKDFGLFGTTGFFFRVPPMMSVFLPFFCFKWSSWTRLRPYRRGRWPNGGHSNHSWFMDSSSPCSFIHCTRTGCGGADGCRPWARTSASAMGLLILPVPRSFT